MGAGARGVMVSLARDRLVTIAKVEVRSRIAADAGRSPVVVPDQRATVPPGTPAGRAADATPHRAGTMPAGRRVLDAVAAVPGAGVKVPAASSASKAGRPAKTVTLAPAATVGGPVSVTGPAALLPQAIVRHRHALAGTSPRGGASVRTATQARVVPSATPTATVEHVDALHVLVPVPSGAVRAVRSVPGGTDPTSVTAIHVPAPAVPVRLGESGGIGRHVLVPVPSVAVRGVRSVPGATDPTSGTDPSSATATPVPAAPGRATAPSAGLTIDPTVVSDRGATLRRAGTPTRDRHATPGSRGSPVRFRRAWRLVPTSRRRRGTQTCRVSRAG